MTIDINLNWILFLSIIGIALFLLHSGFNINLFVKKDKHIADKFFDKFPLVTSEFLEKTHKEQTIENNQEIQELRTENEQLKEYIEKELTRINEVLKENGQIR